MGQPALSLDRYVGLHEYGDWVFFRYLTERMKTAQGGLPVLVRRIWQHAVGTNYSVSALKQALAEQGTDLPTQLAGFTVANRRPGTFYREGANYRAAPLDASRRLSRGDSVKATVTLDHLAASTVRFVPSAGDNQVTLTYAPALAKPGLAAVVVRNRSGKYHRVANLTSSSRTETLTFDPTQVTAVLVSMVNTGSDYTCWTRTRYNWEYTCQGTSNDNNAQQSVTADVS